MRLISRTSLTLVLSLSVVISIASTESSFSAVKAGSTCAMAGQTLVASGKKFTCVKVGKKLQWNKGTSLATTQSPSSPSAKPTASSPSATPIAEFNAHDVVIAQVSDQWKKWRTKSTSTFTPLKMILESGYDPAWNNATKASDLLISAFNGNGYKLVQTPISILGDSEDWLASTGTPLACGRRVPEQPLGIYCGHIQLGFGYFMVNEPQNVKYVGKTLNKRESDLIDYLVAHDVATMYELQAQYGSVPYDGSKNQIPAWIREGFVQLFAALAVSDSNAGKKNYFEYISSANLIDRFPSKLCTKNLQDFESKDRNWGGSCISSQNFFAVELLTARHGGLDALFAFVTQFGNSNDWTGSFKSAFGISREDFYTEWYDYLKIPQNERPALTPAAPSVHS
jgi:hypothetical protein